MDPNDFGSSSNSYSGSSHGKKRDLFEMAFDPWATAGTSSLPVQHQHHYNRDDGKKAKLYHGTTPSLFQQSYGHRSIEHDRVSDDDEQLLHYPASEKVPELGISSGPVQTKAGSDTEPDISQSQHMPLNSTECDAGSNSNIDKKVPDELEADDPEQDGSSATTTPSQSSSEPDQTPRSSNDANGEKSDKGESESSKSVQQVNASNGCVVNYISPSITKRSVTLQMLLAAGILKPGEGTMSLEYHGQKFMGDLLENGQIRSQETSQIFSSPSAWATTCKQIINPDKSLRKSGCGWASIKYKSLKLDYYKAVWFKRLREGSIDIRNISNGVVISSSSDTDDEDRPHCILKFGEHFDNNPRNQSAQQIGAKILISCTEFKEMERLQPFHVKVSAEALALADFHCNVTNTEAVGYISGRWNGDQNILKMETAHPCQIFMPASTVVECDNERNRIALEIQGLGNEVVGWYHSHPKAPPIPSKDDIARQLDYQVMMKGASEASYIPCVGIIISPLCYSEQTETHQSSVQFFWAMPPPENRPLEIGRPMHIDYETCPSTEFDPKKLLNIMTGLVEFYKIHKELMDVTELGGGKLARLTETVSSWLPALKVNEFFWSDIEKCMKSEVVSAPRVASPAIPSRVNSSSTSTSSSPAHQMMDDENNETVEREATNLEGNIEPNEQIET